MFLQNYDFFGRDEIFYLKKPYIYKPIYFSPPFFYTKTVIMTISKMGLALLFSVLLLACSDDDLLNRRQTPFLRDCHQEMSWDSLSTFNQVIGEWDWYHKHCAWGSFEGDSVSDKGVKVIFFENGTLELYRDTLIKTANWTVKPAGANSFQLKHDSLVNNINGSINFCENEMSFNDTPRDGCENFFRKIE